MTTSKIQLPDIEEMMQIVDDIYELSLRKTALEVDLSFAETLISREASTNEKYFRNGKAPSQSSIKDTWFYGGFDGELVPRRRELGEISAKIDMLKNKLTLLRDMIEIWRTQSANERTSVMQ